MLNIVVGKNFGDEGKGLAVDYFSYLSEKNSESSLVIRHNGGAQAGHTVDLTDTRFVFHQLSSGSFRKADTLWEKTFLPDLYKLPEEVSDFYNTSGKTVKILAFAECRCVYIDDVLLNMALETSRGSLRHGSCGMGINEAVQRSFNKDFCITLHDIKSLSSTDLYKKLSLIRKEYLRKRLEELSVDINSTGEYGELMTDETVLKNVAEIMSEASDLVDLVDESIYKKYDNITFEGAQGLLLDENYLRYAPHLTTSSTTSAYPLTVCEKHFKNEKPQVVYVSRSYVTRHGAGPLPFEGDFDPKRYGIYDKTNITNDWQGSLRFAPHPTSDEFVRDVIDDISENKTKCTTALLLTHLNETNNMVCSTQGLIDAKKWCSSDALKSTFDHFYFSSSKFSHEIELSIL